MTRKVLAYHLDVFEYIKGSYTIGWEPLLQILFKWRQYLVNTFCKVLNFSFLNASTILCVFQMAITWRFARLKALFGRVITFYL